MNYSHKILSSFILASLITAAPLFASASTLNATTSTAVVINPNGVVHVVGANVTSVGTNVINAVTKFGNTMMSWVINVSPTTKVNGHTSVNASTTPIRVGDTIGFTGALAGSNASSITVNASKIHDRNATSSAHTKREMHKKDKQDEKDERKGERGRLGIFGGLHLGHY